jgi:hypothetical protein
LILLSGINGCGSRGKGVAQDGDSLMQEEIRLSNEYADALEQGADFEKVGEINQRMMENSKKFEALPQAERDRLTKKYNQDRMQAGMRAAKAALNRPGAPIGNFKSPDSSNLKGKK